MVAHHAHLAGIPGESPADSRGRFLCIFLGAEIPHTQPPVRRGICHICVVRESPAYRTLTYTRLGFGSAHIVVGINLDSVTHDFALCIGLLMALWRLFAPLACSTVVASRRRVDKVDESQVQIDPDIAAGLYCVDDRNGGISRGHSRSGSLPPRGEQCNRRGHCGYDVSAY